MFRRVAAYQLTNCRDFDPKPIKTNPIPAQGSRCHLSCESVTAQLLAEFDVSKAFMPTVSSLSGFVFFWYSRNMLDELRDLLLINKFALTAFLNDISTSCRGKNAKPVKAQVYLTTNFIARWDSILTLRLCESLADLCFEFSYECVACEIHYHLLHDESELLPRAFDAEKRVEAIVQSL